MTPTNNDKEKDAKWREQLTDLQYEVTRCGGTEAPFTGAYWDTETPGLYRCVCCDNPLFRSETKYDSGTGWPSFWAPYNEESVKYADDYSLGMHRIEVLCAKCNAHLGHRFPDGPEPTGQRYCMNSAALLLDPSEEQKEAEQTPSAKENTPERTETKDDADANSGLEKATLGGGCFWCLEPIFSRLQGVHNVMPGYAGGHTENPSYEQVCTGTTGHAEVVQITFDPKRIGYVDLLNIFFEVHDPTTPNRQGNDVGPQYRSIILYHSKDQKRAAEEMIQRLEKEGVWREPIVTEVEPLTTFYAAEQEHHQYYERNPEQGYCFLVIRPKVERFTRQYADQLK